MNKKLHILIIITLLIFTVLVKDITKTNCLAKAFAVTFTPNPTTTLKHVIDYNQYAKKIWVTYFNNNGKGDSNSLYIAQISKGKITGYFETGYVIGHSGYEYDNQIGYLTGIISASTAKCKFKDIHGNMGNITLYLNQNNLIKAAITYTHKEIIDKVTPIDGRFNFRPYNISDEKKNGYNVIKSQSFNINLNSWGNVRFVSGSNKDNVGSYIECYLTDKGDNILYSFGSKFFLGSSVKAVSFRDLNKDGLKDIIIIASEFSNGLGYTIAWVYLQKPDGRFSFDEELNNDMNNSVTIKSIKDVLDYYANPEIKERITTSGM